MLQKSTRHQHSNTNTQTQVPHRPDEKVQEDVPLFLSVDMKALRIALMRKPIDVIASASPVLSCLASDVDIQASLSSNQRRGRDLLDVTLSCTLSVNAFLYPSWTPVLEPWSSEMKLRLGKDHGSSLSLKVPMLLLCLSIRRKC